MLQKMRERTQGIIAGVIVALICITFALWGIQNYTRNTRNDDSVAEVNGVKITPQQLQLAYEKARQREIAQGHTNLDQKSQATLKQQVLQQLIDEIIVTRALSKLGFTADSSQIRVVIAAMPMFQEKSKFSSERMQQILSNLSISEREFFAELQHSIMLNQFEGGLATSAFALPDELTTAAKLINQKRDFSYVVIKPESFAAQVVVDDQAIAQYYEQHKNDFLIPEKISIEYIELRADDLKKETKADKQRQHEIFSERNDKLADLVYTNSDSLAPAAQALNLTIKSTEMFTREGSKIGLMANPKVINAAFSEAVLRQNYNSNPIEIGPGDLIVLRIKTHVADSIRPLPEVKAQIIQQLKADKMQQAAQKLGEKVIELLQAESLEKVNKQEHLIWNSAFRVERQNKQIDAKILNTAFSLQPQTGNKIAVMGVNLGKGGYAVVRLNSIYDGDERVSSTQQRALNHDLPLGFGQFDYYLWLENLKKKAKIKTMNN